MKKFNKSTGITLIALVVTIVVLLILAGASISMLVGDNGIITQAQEANVKTENGEVYEALLLKVADNNINNATDENDTDALNYLLSEGYIDDNNIVNVNNLTGRNMKTGNGSDDKDIYKIENGNLYYYDKNGEKIEIGDLFETEILEETDPSLFEITEGGTVSLKDYDDYYKNGVSNWPFVVENLVIPKEINGIIVTKISSGFCVHYSHVKSIYIPDTVISIGSNAFEGCENLKTITIKNKQGIISGEPWKAKNAKITYSNTSIYEDFANNYVLDKKQEELEELILKSENYLGTFDEYLTEKSMTREKLEEIAIGQGMTYMEYLKNILIYEFPNSWIRVEYMTSIKGGEEKTIEELENLFIEKVESYAGIGAFEKILEEQGITKEQFFEEAYKEEGFRTKKDLLKYMIYFWEFGY